MTGAPRSEQFDDVYFSAYDGPGETAHVFFDGNDLTSRLQGAEDGFVIGETGFGTGLNFLLAWDLFDRTAPTGAFLDFVSVEKFPLSAQDIRNGLSPWAQRLDPYLSKMLAQYPIRVPGFHRMVFDNRVALTLVFGDANDVFPEVEAQVDAWFLDGFTPSKNPDMWTDTLFSQMARMSHDNTTFATFTAAGFVKRGLQTAGFAVEKRKGFGPKRDMLAGRFVGKRKKTKPDMPKRIVIHGAGLAGCSAAYVLKQYGLDPVLYDPNGIASGASGNPVGIINPRFTAFRTAESDFYTAAFAQAARTLPRLDGIDYRRCGSLHLVTDDDKEKRFTRTVANWGWHADHMRYLDAAEASSVAGIVLKQQALYLPDSACVNPAALCGAYAKDIPLLDAPEEGEAVIMATGAAVEGLPVHTVRGQVTMVEAGAASAGLRCNLCYGGYISAPLEGRHVVGSTFQKWLTDTDVREEDDADNLAKLAAIAPSLMDLRIAGSRAALRTASHDRFPVVGPFNGTCVTTAHGSHGIASTLAAAHLLADFLRGGPFSLGKETMKALWPSRFQDRKMPKETKQP